MAQSLKESEVAGRYAKALYELSQKAQDVPVVAEDLHRVVALIDASPELTRALTSPLLSDAEIARLAALIAESAKATLLTGKFIALLGRRRRLALLPKAAQAFHALVAEAAGEVTAKVTLATQVRAQELDAVAKQLSGAIGKKVRLDVDVDPEILGGMVVRVGARLIDASVRGKLERLKQELKRPVAA